MNSKIETVIGRINEAVGSVKANARNASVRDDGVRQEQLGKDQQQEHPKDD